MNHLTHRNRQLLAFLTLVVITGAVLAPDCDDDQNGPTGDTGTRSAIAVAIGLNQVDPQHYGGWSGDLTGCEPDADDMAKIAAAQKFTTIQKLLTSQATRQAVLDAIQNAASTLKEGDLFVLSYSGHGGQLPDLNGDEPDGMDETWCLYDGELLDDELHGTLSAFAKGVRVLVFSDSCHSGTVIKMLHKDFKAPPPQRISELRATFKSRSAIMVKSRDRAAPTARPIRAIPPTVAIKTYEQNKDFYDKIGTAAPREDKAGIKCSVILISGCEDPQLSADLGTNGLFTYALKEVWNGGAFNGDHHDFHAAIKAKVLVLNSEQAPYYFTINADEQHEQQRPYTVAP